MIVSEMLRTRTGTGRMQAPPRVHSETPTPIALRVGEESRFNIYEEMIAEVISVFRRPAFR